MNVNKCKNNLQSSSGTTELGNLGRVTSPLCAPSEKMRDVNYMIPEALFSSQFYLGISDQLAS